MFWGLLSYAELIPILQNKRLIVNDLCSFCDLNRTKNNEANHPRKISSGREDLKFGDDSGISMSPPTAAAALAR